MTVWKIIKHYFKEKGFLHGHISSFNNFIENTIPSIVSNELHPISINHTNSDDLINVNVKVSFGSVYLDTPQNIESDGSINYLLPYEVKLRSLTYHAPLYVDVVKTCTLTSLETKQTNTETTNEKIILAWLPIMLQSNYCSLTQKIKEGSTLVECRECEYDQGGYFIINGTERIIVKQEGMCTNQDFVFVPKDDTISVEIRSVEPICRKAPAALKCTLVGTKCIRVEFICIKKTIPLFLMFRALGVILDEDIINLITDPNDKEIVSLLQQSLEESYPIETQDEALEWIGKNTYIVHQQKEMKIKSSLLIIQKEFLPHVGTDDLSFKDKARFLASMVKKLLYTITDRRKFDDRDHYGNKRLLLPGPLLEIIFRNSFFRVYNECSMYISKRLESKNNYNKEFTISSIIDSKTITQELIRALSTGNWPNNKTGVSQVLSRLNYLSTISHCHRITTPSTKNGTTAKPRQLHSSQWGSVCPVETPEGAATGLTKYDSIMCHYSTYYSPIYITDWLQDNGLCSYNDAPLSSQRDEKNNKINVYINGKPEGYILEENVVETVNKLRKQKRENISVHFDTSIVLNFEKNELRIQTDGGRTCRPLFIVDDNNNIKNFDNFNNWEELISNETIEYLDKNEEEQNFICMMLSDLKKYNKNYTYCELHPSLILGIMASTIPFPDHNQSPRNCYQSSMGKAALGVYQINYQHLFDTMSHVMMYPQKPLTRTHQSDYLNFDKLPAGQTAIVAITNYHGWNQEDALILNQSSIDRGLFRTIFYRTYTDKETKTSTKEEVFGKPKEKKGNKVDEDGLPSPGTYVTDKDNIICKINHQEKEGEKHKFSNTTVKYGESGVVDKVMITTNKEGTKTAKVRVRSVRIPQIGDKFAAMNAQKCTVSLMVRQEDMPFTIEGITPDIIINALCIPSRMTMELLIELLVSKLGCVIGEKELQKLCTATPFEPFSIEKISDTLHSLGLPRFEKQVMYDGHTGKQFEAMICISPMFYQRLKHMVDDKVHARSRGPMQALVRQPLEGRSRDGGLRWGEMERDNSICQGISFMLNERLLKVSDLYRVEVCGDCGIIGTMINVDGYYECSSCKSTNVKKLKIPYACKLAFQELMAMNIAPRIKYK